MDGKDFFQSKQTWSAIVLLLIPILNKFGIQVDQQDLVDAAMMIVSGVLFVWGMFSKSRSPVKSIAGVKVAK